LKRVLISLIKAYQRYLSPHLPASCRFYPSCSEYSLQAIEKYGSAKGLWLSFRRLIKCNPLHPGGYDPLIKEPPKKAEGSDLIIEKSGGIT